MKRGSGAAARRYARALLDVVLANPREDGAAVRAGLESIAEAVATNAELAAAFAHPSVSTEKKKAIAERLVGSGLVLKLVALLLERGRIEILGEIARAYTRIWNVHRRIVEVEASSAVPLDQTQLAALKTASAQAAGGDVELSARVDQALLGGVVLHLGGLTFDGSVRTQLKRLRERLRQSA